MPTVAIDDAEDPRLADYVRLREVSLRKLLETERGLFIAEGDRVIRRAIEAGYRPRSFLLADRWQAGLADVTGQWPDVPVYLVSTQLAETITGFHVHRGALASLHREQRHEVRDLLALRRLVVLEDIVDHTNVGAILRNAAGLGWDGALLSPRAADPLYRRSIKVSMGAIFSLPWARLTDWAGAPALLRESGFRTLALTPAVPIPVGTLPAPPGAEPTPEGTPPASRGEDALDLEDARRRLNGAERIAIMLGTEGAGLSARWSEGADLRVCIPMHAGIDSLNVAAAAAIACYRLH